MAYNTTQLQKSINETKLWFEEELSSLRTGRATPTLLDGVSLEVYGSRVKLNQVATILVEDARSLYVSPYDTEQIKLIEKAVTVADLGVSVGSDERGVRVSFPELTAERRQQLIKILKGKHEEARIALKQKRTEAISTLEKEQLSEDEVRDGKSDIQKIIDDGNKVLEDIADKKEKDLSS